MKILFLLFFSLFFLSLVSATEISVLEETYLAGETVQVYVNATTLFASEIVLYDSNHSAKTISPLFTSYRNGKYFLSFDLYESYLEGEYTLKVNDASDTFQIIPTNGQAVLRVKPAFIFLDPDDDTFSLLVSNIGEGSTTVNAEVFDTALDIRKTQLAFAPGQEQKYYVDYRYYKIHSDLILNLSYGTQQYIIPILYPDLTDEQKAESIEPIVMEEMKEEEEAPVESFALLITEPRVSLELEKNQSRYGDLKVENLLNESLRLHYSLTDGLLDIAVLNQSSVILEPGEIYSMRVWFNPQNNSREGDYSGTIEISDGSFSEHVDVTLLVVGSVQSESTENVLKEADQEYELVYEGETLVPKEDHSGLYIVAGILIFLLLVLIVLVIFKLRQKNERRFTEYIESTKKKRK